MILIAALNRLAYQMSAMRKRTLRLAAAQCGKARLTEDANQIFSGYACGSRRSLEMSLSTDREGKPFRAGAAAEPHVRGAVTFSCA